MKNRCSGFSGKFYFLSNFYPCKIIDLDFGRDIEYPSVEHAYQAHKTFKRDKRYSMSKIRTASAAKRAGRKLVIRSDWEESKIEIMTLLLCQKFSDPVMNEMLLSTGNLELVETNWWGDTFWGVYGGKGNNMLGKILMEIRKANK